MEIEFFKKLSGDLTNLLKNGEDFNVIIEVGGQMPDCQIFKAHSIILNFRCSYFRNELIKTSYDNMNIKKIRMPHIPVNAFEIIIKYIYGGIVSFDKVHASTILDLSTVASEFCLEELVNIAQSQLVKDHPSWIRLKFAKVFKICFEYDDLKVLKDFCNEIIAKTPSVIFDSVNFEDLSEKALVSLLKLDTLQMKEGKIWDYVIRWGIAQNPNMDSNPTQWSDANFSTLKTTLKNCLPHIRYFQIVGEDVIKKLYPYQQIIEPNLWKDIMTKFAAPNMPITSTILSPRKFANSKFPPRNTGTSGFSDDSYEEKETRPTNYFGIDMPTFQSSTSEDVPILIDDNFNDTVRPTTPPFQSSIGIEKNIPPPINNEYDAKGQTPFTSFMNRRNTPPLINNEYDSKGQNFFTSFRNTPSLNNNEYDSKEQNTYASFMNRKNAPPLINNEYDSKEQNIFASMMSRKNTPPLINNDNEYDAKEQNTLTPFIMKNTPPLINNEYDPKERNTLASFMNRKNTPPLINNEKYDSKEKDTSASFLDGDFQLHQPYQPLKPYKPKLKPDQPQPKLYQPQFSDFPKESSTGIVNATNNEYDFKKHNIFLKYKNKYDSKEKSSSASFLDGDSQPHLKMKFKPLQRPAPNRRNPPKEPSTGVVNAAKNWGKKT